MKTIYKYPLKIDTAQRVSMPEGAELLDVQCQAGVGPCLWALVDTDKPHVARKILIHGTGHPAENIGKHIATFQMHGGGLVFHAFESMENE